MSPAEVALESAMKSVNLFAGFVFTASLFATCGVLAAPPESREVVLAQRDFSDCSNADVDPGASPVEGGVTVDRGVDGNTHVRVNLKAQPNTTYHFFLKCVRLLGDITTRGDGFAIANFDFRTNSAGDVFAFDMYPEGAPSGNKFQSVQVNFTQPAQASNAFFYLPTDQQISRQALVLPQDFSDCFNSDVVTHGLVVAGGGATIDRGTDGNTHVRVRLRAQPNRTYHFDLKCIGPLGDLTTEANGLVLGNFDFPTNSVGDVFAFEAYSEGAPPGDVFESVSVVFGDLPPIDPPPVVGVAPRVQYITQTAADASTQTAGSVSIAYANMPASSEMVLVEATWGTKTQVSMPLADDTGSLSLPIPPSQSPGKYYVLAQGQADKHYIAQTTAFYIN